MALTASGQLKLSQIATEFSDSPPHAMSEFYNAASGVPASGQLGIANFYGKAAAAAAQWLDDTISVTGSNTTTTQSICNIWYRRAICIFYYTAAEMEAAIGSTSATISGIRFYCTNQPLYQPLPNYVIGMKNGTFSGNPGDSGFFEVKSASSESFTTNSYKEFTLTSSFDWTGGDLALAFAWGQCPTNYNQSGTNYIGSGTTYYTRTDSTGAFTLNGNRNLESTSGRPVLQFYA